MMESVVGDSPVEVPSRLGTSSDCGPVVSTDGGDTVRQEVHYKPPSETFGQSLVLRGL